MIGCFRFVMYCVSGSCYANMNVEQFQPHIHLITISFNYFVNKKAKKAMKKANCDAENILFELVVSYKPAHEVAVWRIAVHLIHIIHEVELFINPGFYLKASCNLLFYGQ